MELAMKRKDVCKSYDHSLERRASCAKGSSTSALLFLELNTDGMGWNGCCTKRAQLSRVLPGAGITKKTESPRQAKRDKPGERRRKSRWGALQSKRTCQLNWTAIGIRINYTQISTVFLNFKERPVGAVSILDMLPRPGCPAEFEAGQTAALEQP